MLSPIHFDAYAQAPQQPRLRVLFIGDHFGYAGGITHGLATYYRAVMPGLARYGVEATLCLLGHDHPAADTLRAHGSKVVFLNRGKWDPRAMKDLRAVVRALRPDVLHLCNFKSMMLGCMLAREMRLPCVLHFHDRLAPPTLLLPILRRVTRNAQAAIAVSDSVRRFTAETYRLPERDIDVLHNGIDLRAIRRPRPAERAAQRRRLGVSEDAPVIASIGRLIPPKRIPFLIQVMPAVLQARPDAVLLVIGDGPERRACEAQAQQLGLGAAVRFLGLREDVLDLLAATDVVALSSMDEGLPYVLLESAARAVPAVAFDVGGVPEIVLNEVTGLIAAPGDLATFAAALARLAGDPVLARRLGTAARERVQRFDLELHLSTLADLYDSTMAEATRARA